MNIHARQRPDVEEIIADPMFRRGYAEIFDDREARFDQRWSDAESLAYGRGRSFGAYVQHQEGERVPLARGALVHPQARLLLSLAFKDGDVI